MFFPPLDSTVAVDIPSNARAGGVSLLFRARTGSASALEQLKRDGVKVQAWTNAPVLNGPAEGVWGAYSFEETPVATPAKLDDSIVPFSLSSPTEDNVVDDPYTLFLTLRLRALPHSQSEKEFQVTYRLLYPNGEIKWLGYPRRDLRCVLKKTDPWLAPPTPVDQQSNGVYRIFSSITMKELWGCWAVGPRCVKYCPKGSATDSEAAFLVFVPRLGRSTFALHQPIILHGAGLKLDSSGVVTCRTYPPTRVYTAITSETELSVAIPDLGLQWFGVKEGYAIITSAPPEQSVGVHAVPLFIDPATAAAPNRSTTVSLDLASHGILAEHSRYVAYSHLSNEVLDSGDWGSRPLHLSIGRSGGSCVVSPVYTLSTNKPLPFGKAPWGIAYVTPHVLVAVDREKEKDSTAEVEVSKLEYNSENAELLSRDIKPQTPPPPPPPPPPPLPLPPSRPPAVTTIALNPRRTVAFLISLIWRTLGLLIRALIMRLFVVLGLPLSPLVSYLLPSHLKGDIIERQANARLVERKARPSAVAKVGRATSEKGSGPGETKSDSTSEVASAVRRCDKRRASRVFDLPKGPFSLLAHTERAVDVDGDDEKTRSQFPEVILDGERVDLKITALGHGWIIMQTKADVNGGKVEMYVYDMEASTENGRSR